MILYYIAFALTVVAAITSLLPNSRWERFFRSVFLVAIVVLLVLLAGLRGANVDRDYSNYFGWFSSLASNRVIPATFIKDPAFTLVALTIGKLSLKFVIVTLVFAAAGLFAKLKFADLTCEARWVPLFFYLLVCRSFFAQEMTQIRAAIAIPLLSLGILWAARGHSRRALLSTFVAICFHLSTIVGLPIVILLIRGVRFKSIWWVASLVPIGITVAIFLQGLLAAISDVARISAYLEGQVETGSINFFSVFLIFKVIVLGAILTQWKRLSFEERLIVYCSSLGLFFLLLLAANDNLALRTADLFSLFDLLLFLLPLYYLRRYAAYAYFLVLLGFGGALFASSVRIMHPYSIASGAPPVSEGTVQCRRVLPSSNFRSTCSQSQTHV